MAATDGLPNTPVEGAERESEIGALPTRLRLLCVGSVEPSWVSLTLQLDALGCVEPNFKWVSTANEALALLRDENFDSVLELGRLDLRRSEMTVCSELRRLSAIDFSLSVRL